MSKRKNKLTEEKKQLKKLFKQYSAKEISELIGVSTATVYRWKSGQFMPDEDNQSKIDILLAPKVTDGKQKSDCCGDFINNQWGCTLVIDDPEESFWNKIKNWFRNFFG